MSDREEYQVYDSNFLSYNYGYVDLETSERERAPNKISKLGYSLLSDAKIIAGSEFVFKGTLAIKQKYIESKHLKNSKYATFKGGILNSNDYILSHKLAISKRVLPKGIFISGSYEKNWYHWLIEILPRLYVLTKIKSEFEDFKIIVTEDVFKLLTHRQSLECFVNLEDLITVDSTKVYKVEQLLIIDACFIIPPNIVNDVKFSLSDCFTHYGIMKSYKHHLESQLSKKKNNKAFERVFLYRSQKKRKYNQDQVLSLLKAYDFQAIDFSKLDFFEQMQVIKNAKLIVGPAGAAWANILFCSSNTNCIIFRPHNTGNNPFLNNLSMLSNSKIYEIRYFNPSKNWGDLIKNDLHVAVDLEVLEELVVRLIN